MNVTTYSTRLGLSYVDDVSLLLCLEAWAVTVSLAGNRVGRLAAGSIAVATVGLALGVEAAVPAL